MAELHVGRIADQNPICSCAPSHRVLNEVREQPNRRLWGDKRANNAG
jgi:hypothetical protein